MNSSQPKGISVPTVLPANSSSQSVDLAVKKAQEVGAKVPGGLFLRGGFVETENRVEVEDPSSGAVIGHVGDAGVDDALDALTAACEAGDAWASTPAAARADVLRAAYEITMERADFLADVISAEMGKARLDAVGEVTYGAAFLKWFAEEASRLPGRFAVAPSGSESLITMSKPVGPVLAVTPWNFPLAMGTRKIGPAFAAGCPVLIKPASLTPLTMNVLCEIFAEAGLPQGVLACLPTSRTSDVVDVLLADPRLAKLTFTGSTKVGAMLAEKAAPNLLRVSLELGGNAPFVVCEDADIDAAVDGAMLAKMRGGGQACTAANRFIVHEAVVGQFAQKLAAAMDALQIGPGLADGTSVGPLVSVKAASWLREQVAEAIDAGARQLCGDDGRLAHLAEPHRYVAPTVLTDVAADAHIADVELFGPVAPIITVGSDDQAIDVANNTRYGLASYVYTESHRRAWRYSHALNAGMVGVNTGLVSNPAAPFGGVGLSGYGREGGREGIAEYISTRYVNMPQ